MSDTDRQSSGHDGPMFVRSARAWSACVLLIAVAAGCGAGPGPGAVTATVSADPYRQYLLALSDIDPALVVDGPAAFRRAAAICLDLAAVMRAEMTDGELFARTTARFAEAGITLTEGQVSDVHIETRRFICPDPSEG